MTARLVKWIGPQSMGRTFASIAEEIGVDEKTVRKRIEEKLRRRYIHTNPIDRGGHVLIGQTHLNPDTPIFPRLFGWRIGAKLATVIIASELVTLANSTSF